MEVYMLKLNNVSYRYSNKHQTIEAVKDVNAVFERGKFYVIKGKSGSGKTTLLSLLAALDNPTSGEVLCDNAVLAKLDGSNYRLKTAAVIYQSYNLFPLLTALENVLLPLQLQKVDKLKAKNAAKRALELVGLDDKYFNRYPSMLSGGEQQRVAIARALASGSEILLADEPTGNLDTENSSAIVSILCKLAHEENKLVITVTHDMEIAARADEAFEMSDGNLTAK
jgi:putative ABC transport system ATP-binding protein